MFLIRPLQMYGTPAYQKRLLVMVHCCLHLLLWGQLLFRSLPQRTKAPPKGLDPFFPTPAYQAHPQNSKFLIQRVDRKKCWNAPLLSHASAALQDKKLATSQFYQTTLWIKNLEFYC